MTLIAQTMTTVVT